MQKREGVARARGLGQCEVVTSKKEGNGEQEVEECREGGVYLREVGRGVEVEYDQNAQCENFKELIKVLH